MRIKRWTVWDGINNEYTPERYVFRKSAEMLRDAVVYQHVLTAVNDNLDVDQEYLDTSVKVIELR